MLKNQIKIITMLCCVALLNSCSKEDFSEESQLSNLESVAVDELNYNYNTLSDQDKIKVLVGNAVSDYLINNNAFNDRLFAELITPDNKTREFLYIKEKDNLFVNGKSFEDLILDFYINDEAKRNLIAGINTTIPNLVIKISEWTEVVLGDPSLDLEFAVYPCILDYRKSGILFKDGAARTNAAPKNNSNVVSQYLPIQIEESERLIPVNKNSTTTLWGDDFYVDNFPFLDGCTDFVRSSYTTYSNETYDFIDKISLNTDLMNGDLCAILLPDEPTISSCNIVYERDCRVEKNVMEGFKLSNLSVFTGVNNQPGGEDVLSLHYNFSVASMCGNLMQTEICPPSDWTFVFFGTFFNYFELQRFNGRPTPNEQLDTYFIGSNYYLKALPKYYDIPAEFSAQGIYAQARFLPLSENGTWDGNKYGDAISFAIHEHDDIIVGQTTTNSVMVTNTTRVSTKLNFGDFFEVGGDFSQTVTRSSSTTVVLNAAEDVELGKTATNYYERNFTNPSIGFGYNIPTGSVNTHFAFYY